MQVRLVTAATIAGALLLSVSGAQAAPPTLDGKKIKVLELTAVGAPQANGSSVELGHCASAGNPSEKLFVEAKALKKGKKYVLVADFFRTVSETVKSKVEIAVPNSTKTTVPADVDEFTALNCTL